MDAPHTQSKSALDYRLFGQSTVSTLPDCYWTRWLQSDYFRCRFRTGVRPTQSSRRKSTPFRRFFKYTGGKQADWRHRVRAVTRGLGHYQQFARYWDAMDADRRGNEAAVE